MLLHEFLSAHRAELLNLCVDKLRESAPGRSDAELLGNLPAFLDDLIQAMRREAGLPGKSELPAKSSLAVELGRQRQEYGFELAIASLSFGVVSDSTGELGGRYGLSFEASDYQQFN